MLSRGNRYGFFGDSTLKVGDEGTEVADLQMLLSAIGFGVEISGLYDMATMAAVKEFQDAQGLESDGVVSSATWTQLRAVAPKEDVSPVPQAGPRPPGTIEAEPLDIFGSAAWLAPLALIAGGLAWWAWKK